jgi:hypothetical protein
MLYSPLVGVPLAILQWALGAAIPAGSYWELARADERARTRPTADWDPAVWRNGLVSALIRPGVRQIANGSVGWWYLRRAARLTLIVSAVLCLLAIPYVFLAVSADGTPHRGAIVLGLFLVCIPLALFGVAVALEERRRIAIERRGLNAVVEIERAYAPPVLYLRSFRFDRESGRAPLLAQLVLSLGVGGIAPTPEMALVQALPRQVPVVAIGKPRERNPPSGALRFYVEQDEWQRQIEIMIPQAQLVVWVTGFTEGLKWELNHLRSKVPPERLVLWTHTSLTGSKAQRRHDWQRFLAVHGSVFPHPLPEDGYRHRFIVFGEDWVPIGAPGAAYPTTLRDRFRLGTRPIRGWRSILRERLMAYR